MTIDIADIKIALGSGTSDFPMKRGSFKYKNKIKNKRRATPEEIGLKIRKSSENDAITEITFDALNKKERTSEIASENSSENESKNIEYNRIWLTFPVGEDEHFYGCGETFSEFDLKGKKVRIWVAEHQNAARISGKIIKRKLFGKKSIKTQDFSKYESYYVQPTFVSSAGYFVHVCGKGYMEFDFTVPGCVTVQLRENAKIVTGSGLDINGKKTPETFEKISENLSGVIGRQKTLPEWLYDGAILAVQGGTDIVSGKIEALLNAGVKTIGIWSQDWCGCRRTGFGYQVMWNWEWDRELYLGLDEKIKEWKAKGIRFLGYINPFMALEKDLYKYATEHGYCVKNAGGEDYLVTITTFPAAMIDLTNPDAWEWYKGIIKSNMIDLGMGGWMADFGEYLPTDCRLFSGEDPWEKHNEWPALWAQLNREAVDEAISEGRCDRDVFFFTRAGFTDTVKYSPVMWNGDQHVDWSFDDGLASVIPATLSLAMSGFGITHSDIGGYTTIMDMTRSRELLERWAEMNAFSPIMRSHEGNQPSRNVQFDADSELLRHFALVTGWHVALKEYLQECVKETEKRGIPVMRPLFYHYDEEDAYTEKYEYLLGRDILVAPVLKETAMDREVYLPQDEWVHIFTGEEYSGGKYTVKAPIGQPPVFIRKSSSYKINREYLI